uniref:Uncharacterized protein n=1 Tax=Oryza barthii TaxID=65489 RepID=A0A0D3FQX5_9ORYZ
MSSLISSAVSPLSLPAATYIRTAVEYIETAKRPKATPTARQGSHKQVEAAADDIPSSSALRPLFLLRLVVGQSAATRFFPSPVLISSPARWRFMASAETA